jgi:ABC-type nitrate/sulfonate/bicarbonate transport system substrate-binding protein
MGGPQVNITQMMAAGQADCVMGSSDLQMVQMREGGVPVTTVAAVFQKDPQVLIAHEDVKRFEDLKGKTILIAAPRSAATGPGSRPNMVSPTPRPGPTPSISSRSWWTRTRPSKAI